ncbi:MAG: MFS transporter [Planctomycetaceae bacterium]|nr:MFS transporter [Planctomycetales bacterium]MCB9921319.1 MFS transporter [Planctomycetaceae bacterium]
MPELHEKSLRWYEGITGYQWLVLVVASLGWVFDIFEGQVFVASMRDAMPQLLGAASADDPLVGRWNNYALASFLLGGAFGGIFFGMLSDKIGRSKTMIVTILFYSVFTCITAFANAAWQMVLLRFLVAMGVGGEWAVASAMVAEVMPKRSRPVMSSIFHASSVFGTLMAVAVGYFIISAKPWGDDTWRLGFLIGIVPALLVVVIRWKMKEPEQWQQAKERERQDASQVTGSIADLFNAQNLRNTLVGVALATIGLVTFWGCHIYGKNALLRSAERTALSTEDVASDATKEVKKQALDKHEATIKRAEMTSMCLNTIGGGLGLVLFGGISNLLGRKGAFVLYHAGGLVMAMLMFLVLIPQNASVSVLYIALPVFGFLTLGMHAGYAVYFPELFPTRLRGTGTGFCFNAGRFGTAAAMFVAAQMSWNPEQTALYLAPLFGLGVIVTLMGQETRGEELPD